MRSLKSKTGEEGLASRLAARIVRAWAGRPLLVGLCGPQGAGKSTLARRIGSRVQARGFSAVALSIDDLYLTRAERLRLAADVHPLMAVRGPPGTHDLDLGRTVLDALMQGASVRLPSFDKARDDRSAEARPVDGPRDVILFEGWCVGARPQPSEALAAPINALEREEDGEGVWRRHVNQALAGSYQDLFARLDLYMLLQPPSFEAVLGWRRQQEQSLRRRTGMGMSDAEVGRFVQHYERLSRHIAREAPLRADVVVWLDSNRRPTRINGA